MYAADRVVDRLHVSASGRDVIRAIRKAIRKGARTDRDLREERKALYSRALTRHASNRDLFRRVMSGAL